MVTYCFFTVDSSIATEEQIQTLIDLEVAEEEPNDVQTELELKIKANLKIQVGRQRILYQGEVLELREIFGLETGGSQRIPEVSDLESGIAENGIIEGQPITGFQITPDTEEQKVVEGQKIENNEESKSMQHNIPIRTTVANKNQKKIESLAGGGEDNCIVCMNAPSNMIVFPCCHLCMCEDCSKEVQKTNKQCPVCRDVIQSLLKFDKNQINGKK